jgi:hypothetical protein
MEHVERRSAADRLAHGLRVHEEEGIERSDQVRDRRLAQRNRDVDIGGAARLTEHRAGERAAEQVVDADAIEGRRDFEKHADRIARQLALIRE